MELCLVPPPHSPKHSKATSQAPSPVVSGGCRCVLASFLSKNGGLMSHDPKWMATWMTPCSRFIETCFTR